MKQKAKRMAGMLAGALVIASGMAGAEEASYLSLGVGYESSSGNYGSTSVTDIASIPVSALYETGPWSLKLIVPYLQITGDGTVIASGRYKGNHGMTTTTTTVTKTRTTQSGLGDLVTMLSYNLYSADAFDSGIDMTGRVKFGTASTALGTGKNDYAVQLYAFHDIGDFLPGKMLGYEMLGSTPQLPLGNVFYGSVGSGYAFTEQTSAGLEYKYAQKASATAAVQRQLTLYANFQLVTDVYLRGYLLKGYADGSPDTGYGVTLSSVF
jgi:hypothetical protein